MTTVKLPAGPQELTTEWLTQALRSTGTIREAAVTAFEPTIIGAGAGFMGQLAQVRLQYDRPEPGAPASLIGKFPASAPENRDLALFFRFYEREVRFYEQIAQRVELRTPRCYYSAWEPATGDYVLLLEDLAPACVGDQLDGCNVAQAEVCIRELSKFHATWWESSDMPRLDWLPGLDADWYVQSVVDGYAKAWPAFAEYFGEHLSPRMRGVAERFVHHIEAVMNTLGSPPVTIIHGDYRLDNLFFPTAHGGEPLAVIDWQISAKARGVFDFAYFIAGTLSQEDRRAKERDLLGLYHRTLVEGGVKDYDFEHCWQDYRLSALILLCYSVIALGSLDMANERGVQLFTTILQRTLATIEDLDAPELLPA